MKAKAVAAQKDRVKKADARLKARLDRFNKRAAKKKEQRKKNAAAAGAKKPKSAPAPSPKAKK